MLIRNCVTDLFNSDDFNVRLTMFAKNPKFFLSQAYKAAWIETIRDSLGEGILNSNKEYKFAITTSTPLSVTLYEGTPKGLMKFITDNVSPSSIRITLFDITEKTWIILIPNTKSAEGN